MSLPPIEIAPLFKGAKNNIKYKQAQSRMAGFDKNVELPPDSPPTKRRKLSFDFKQEDSDKAEEYRQQLLKQSDRLIWDFTEPMLVVKIDIHQIIAILMGQNKSLICEAFCKLKDRNMYLVDSDAKRDCPVFIWSESMKQSDINNKHDIAEEYAKNATLEEANKLQIMLVDRFNDGSEIGDKLNALIDEFNTDKDEQDKDEQQDDNKESPHQKFVANALRECVLNESSGDTLFFIGRMLSIIQPSQFGRKSFICNGLLSPKMKNIQTKLNVLKETQQKLMGKKSRIVIFDDKLFVPTIDMVADIHSNVDIKWMEVKMRYQEFDCWKMVKRAKMKSKDGRAKYEIGTIFELILNDDNDDDDEHDEQQFVVLDNRKCFDEIESLGKDICVSNRFYSWANGNFGGYWTGHHARDQCYCYRVMKVACIKYEHRLKKSAQQCAEQKQQILMLQSSSSSSESSSSSSSDSDSS